MTTDQEVIEAALRIRRALTDLGFAYKTQEGALIEVAFKHLKRAGDRYVVVEVDTERLPPRVAIPRLETPEVLSHLSAVVGKPVKRLNTVGLTYVVMLQPPPKPKPLPSRADLPASAPEGLVWAWPVGVARNGAAVWVDLARSGHLLVGGKTGAGKSAFLNAGLYALLRVHSPATLQLVLTDPKAVEMWPYSGLPHLARPVATTAEEAAGAVAWLVGEVDRREALFKAAGVKNLEAYNRQAPAPLPLVFAVIDEVTDLVLTWGGTKTPPFALLTRVSSKGRAFGVVLCLATQNPRSDVLDTLVRENSGLRVGLKVDALAQSKTILGRSGAELLPAGRPGRLVVVGLPGADALTLQGFFVDDQAVADLVARLRAEEPSPLLPLEADLVAYARDHLDGAFKLSALYEVFKGSISWRQLGKLGRAWELRGWLTKPVDAVSPRYLTDDLLRLLANRRGVAPGPDEAVKGSDGS